MRIEGPSMGPWLKPGRLVIVRAGAHASRLPVRGEVVAARPASLGGRAIVKRVAGLPHERITVEERAWSLQDDELFLLGDCPGQSADSRAFGPVKRSELIGAVVVPVSPAPAGMREVKTSSLAGA